MAKQERQDVAPIGEQCGEAVGSYGGLSVTGRVVARTRRDFRQDDGKIRSCVTYRLLAGVDIVFVDDWSGNVPMGIGALVSSLPVYVRAFKGRDGGAQSRLVVSEDNNGRF